MYTVADRLVSLVRVVPPNEDITHNAIVPEFEKYVIHSSIFVPYFLTDTDIHLFNDGSVVILDKNHPIVINNAMEMRFYVLKLHTTQFAKRFVEAYNRVISEFLINTDCIDYEKRCQVIVSICQKKEKV